jgi:hypothetical protein
MRFSTRLAHSFPKRITPAYSPGTKGDITKELERMGIAIVSSSKSFVVLDGKPGELTNKTVATIARLG